MLKATGLRIGPVGPLRSVRTPQTPQRKMHRGIVRAEGGAPPKTPKKGGMALENRPYRPASKEEAGLRAEAEAPFRSLRLVLFGFGTVSASLATFLSLPTAIAALLGAGTKPLPEAGSDLAINIGALLFCGFFLYRDIKAREKQLARLMREDNLGSCQLELSSGKLLRLGQLRGAARPVIVVGSTEQVAAALAAAESYREELEQRGVFIIGLPLYAASPSSSPTTDTTTTSESASESSSGQASAAPTPAEIPALRKEDLRWRAVPVRLDDWRRWFDEQAGLAGKTSEKGLFVGLRKDGRVRASGVGCPPWAKFIAQLPPEDGMWSGFLDGMDGRV